MKKIILAILMILMMTTSVSALVSYTGQPQFPYIIFGFVDWQNQALGGARIELTNQNTGYSTIITTNIDGYWQEDGSNWLTNSAGRPPVLFGDTIKVKVLDGCGTNDVCEKTFSAFSSGFENKATIDLIISGVIVVTQPSSGGSSGGGSSGGGGGGGSIANWICDEWTPCSGNIQYKVCRAGEFTSKEKRDCVVTEPIPIVTEPEQPIEPESIIPESPEDIPEEPSSILFEAMAAMFILVATALGLKWRWAFIGLARYWWNKGHKLRAIKMFLTATQRAKDEFYSKKK